MKKALTDPVYWLLLVAAPMVWTAFWLLFKLPLTLAAGLSAMQLLMVIAVYPVLEEVVFRGGLQGWLMEHPAPRRQFMGITVANLLVSCVFVAFHFIYHAPLWAALVFVPSLVFGYARDRYKSVAPGIGLHGFYNAGFIGLFG